MAVIFRDAVRFGGSGCDHFEVTIEFDDASQVTRMITMADFETMIDRMIAVLPGAADGPKAREGAMALLWIAYQRKHGKTVAQMRDEIIAQPVT